jgi:hypothetical protein
MLPSSAFRLLACVLAMTGATGGALVHPPPAGAQELPPRVELPPPPPGPCDDPRLPARLELPSGGTNPDRARALVQQASEAAILGEATRARALLEEAAAVDPASPEVAYRLGTILETAGEAEGARLEFCGYLELDPEGPEAADVRARLESLAPVEDHEFPPEARAAFVQGVQALESRDFEAAVLLFSRALVESPGWADAHYNRGLAYLGEGRTGAGAADLERYLELTPGARDRGEVAARLRALGPTTSAPNPGIALVSGLVLPGMGQVYSGRPGRGLLVLAAAGTAAGVGGMYREVDVRCRVPPTEGTCPPDQVAEELSTRPLLMPGLVAAGVITVAGAIQAWMAARDREVVVAGASSGGAVVRFLRGEGDGPRVGLSILPGTGGLRPGEQVTLSLRIWH